MTIKQTIRIKAPAAKVWGMFNDPQFTRRMGGEYISDWKAGSSLQWMGLNGQMLTNGIILNVEKERRLQHSLFYPGKDDQVMAIIIYELSEQDGQTEVTIQEDFADPITEEEKADAVNGWKAALTMVKNLFEEAK